MSIPDPSWKIKTRPCPFYSQGRCLFSDSCNFLHDAKIKVKSPVYQITSAFDSLEHLVSPPSIHVSGVATPPQRVSLDEVVESLRSPPRSPRLSSLLLALGDAIESDEEGDCTEGHTTYDEPDSSGEDVGGLMMGQSFEAEDSSGYLEDGDEDSAYLAYSEGDTLPLAEVVAKETEHVQVFGDSHDPAANAVSSPTHTHSTHPSPVSGRNVGDETATTQSPIKRESTIRRDEDGLLSPIEIKLAAPRTSALESLEPMCHREDSIDSGYADNWTGPTPLAISPPRSERRFSTLSILSSPFGTPSSRVLSPTFVPAASSSWPTSTLFSAKSSVADEAEIAERQAAAGAFMNDLDSPSDYHRRNSSSSQGSAKSGPGVEDTVRPPVADPLHDEGFNDFVSSTSEVVRSTQLGDSEDTQHLHRSFTESPSLGPASAIDTVSSPLSSTALEPKQTQWITAEVDAEVSMAKDIFSNTATGGTPSDMTRRLSMSAWHFAEPEETPFLAETPSRRSSGRGTQMYSGYSDALVFHARDPTQEHPPQRDADAPVPEESSFASNPTMSEAFDEAYNATDFATSEDLEEPYVAAETTVIEESYIAAYTVGSSPDVDPDTSGEVVSSNAPSPFSQPPFEHAIQPGQVSFSEDDDSATNLYEEYYSSVPVSPTGSYSFLAHALDDRSFVASTPSSRVPTPSSSRAPVFTPPGQASHASPDVPNFSTPFRLDSALPSPHLSPPFASVISRPPSQLGSARLTLKPPPSPPLPAESPSPIDPSRNGPSSIDPSTVDQPTTTSSTKVPFGFRHSVRARSREPSISSIQTFGSTSSRHRPPALVGLDRLNDNQSRSSSAGSSHHRESRLLSPEPRAQSTSPRRLKPLRLSLILNPSSAPASSSSAAVPSLTTATTASSRTPSSPTVSSDYSISNNHLLMSPRSATIPDLDTQVVGQISLHEEEEVDFSSRYDAVEAADEMDDTIRGIAPFRSSSPARSRPPSVLHSPVHAIATPRPTLLFAIASDDVEAVRHVLESGEAGPNDDVGPQSALAFAVTSNQLKHKQEIIKLLLAHGANPSALNELQAAAATSRSVSPSESQPGGHTPAPPGVLESLDPATRYFISRAEAPQTRRTSALIHRSFFRPLAKVRYDLIGQDRALEQLFRALSMPTAAPIVVLLCGPSGHGKSLLARRFGSLLDVPTHTVNMTTLTSTHDIWRSYSMSPFEEPSTSTLGDFLTENQGKRCVVVLDEIEKVEDQKYLSSLLMPWELGRCSFEAGQRHVDVSKVIWLGTSNIGHDLVFEHQAQRVEPETAMTREEYVDLMKLLRPQVSERLGPSLLSRVTTVLPFVPFSVEEKMAIAAEALHSLTAGSEEGTDLPAATVEKLVKDSLQGYVPAEGARSLYRAVSTLLLDTIY
ncbi:hypothetical protein EIP91_010755 [Steccherinum ochraceum]|uniref:C3H1-type domain-containing protein n=1 Tax=Steccherinum ochraceum TaxID=92696 RepID=A0A4R0RSJ6_9APHY|nr:hypothetical protein EIP91_010755 [Steccherinum ochraceum]